MVASRVADVRTLRTAAAGVAATVLLFALVLRLGLGGAFVGRAVDDVGQGVAALVAATACAIRATRSSGRWRGSWLLLAVGLLSWALGQTMWSYYELLSGRETPFPSLADVGFLGFPVFALAALLVRPAASHNERGRVAGVLDGVMVAASLFVVSWSTVLGTVYKEGTGNWLSFAVSLAYPAGDLVLLTVAVLVLVRVRARAGLLVLAVGLTAMAVADSGFVYLTTAGTYHTGAFVDIVWFAGFLLMGLSALCPPERAAGHVEPGLQSSFSIVLPYVLVLVGTGAEVIGIVRGSVAPVTLLVIAAALAALFVRQLLVVLDNRRLALNVIEQKEELAYRAFHDPLTGLANRALFHDRLAHALDLHRRDMRAVTVVFIDLDDFKSINDSFGHDAGDAVLVAVAERVRAVGRTGDTIARLGGDEFAVLLEHDGEAASFGARVLDALALPVAVGERKVPVRASIGTTTVPPAQSHTGVDEVLKQADVAMYSAKRAGKGSAVTYTPSLHRGADHDLALQIALEDDVRSGRLDTAFQPIVLASNGELHAMEALARWQHRGDQVAPVDFLPLATRGGFLADIDLLVARNALAEIARAEHPQMLVSTNVCLSRLVDSDLPRRLGDLLADSPVHPERLVIEVSEQDLLDEAQTAATLAAIRELGVGLAIDDFGVGYSNLSRMNALQPDIVKLDRSFVAPLDDPSTNPRLVRRVIELAHDLGAIVIGEGVETPRQRDLLAELGCDALQGYLIGMPTVRVDADTTPSAA